MDGDRIGVAQCLKMSGIEQIILALEFASTTRIIRTPNWKGFDNATQTSVPQTKVIVIHGEHHEIADTERNMIKRCRANKAKLIINAIHPFCMGLKTVMKEGVQIPYATNSGICDGKDLNVVVGAGATEFFVLWRIFIVNKAIE